MCLNQETKGESSKSNYSNLFLCKYSIPIQFVAPGTKVADYLRLIEQEAECRQLIEVSWYGTDLQGQHHHIKFASISPGNIEGRIYLFRQL
jgi:hypothetical protein